LVDWRNPFPQIEHLNEIILHCSCLLGGRHFLLFTSSSEATILSLQNQDAAEEKDEGSGQCKRQSKLRAHESHSKKYK
jgi:hypothetical protein